MTDFAQSRACTADTREKSSHHRGLRVCIGLAVLALLLLPILPGPIAGCYTFSDFTTAGHNFLLFSGGKVTLVLEYATNRPQGTYRYERGVGWVWTDPRTARRIVVKPKLFWVRFEQTDNLPLPPKLPFEYRDFNLIKIRQVIKAKPELADNSARREPATSQ
jgi:hypothetical protein